MHRFVAVLGTVVFVASACGGTGSESGGTNNPSGPEEASEPSPPAELLAFSGDDQSGQVGEELADPLVVKILNENGEPVPNAVISWSVLEGNGALFASATSTNSDGITQNRLTLGTVAGQNKVEPRWINPDTGATLKGPTFTAEGVPGPASTASVEEQPNAGIHIVLIGETLDLAPRISVEDEFGNAVSYGIRAPAEFNANGTELAPTALLLDSVEVLVSDTVVAAMLVGAYENFNSMGLSLTHACEYSTPTADGYVRWELHQVPAGPLEYAPGGLHKNSDGDGWLNLWNLEIDQTIIGTFEDGTTETTEERKRWQIKQVAPTIVTEPDTALIPFSKVAMVRTAPDLWVDGTYDELCSGDSFSGEGSVVVPFSMKASNP